MQLRFHHLSRWFAKGCGFIKTIKKLILNWRTMILPLINFKFKSTIDLESKWFFIFFKKNMLSYCSHDYYYMTVQLVATSDITVQSSFLRYISTRFYFVVVVFLGFLISFIFYKGSFFMIGSGICILNMNIEYEYWRSMQSRIEFYLSFLMLWYRYIEGLFPF